MPQDYIETGKKIVYTAFLITCSFSYNTVLSQDTPPVTFSYQKVELTDSTVIFRIQAKIQPGIKLYSLEKVSEVLPYSAVRFDSSFRLHLLGKTEDKTNLQAEKDSILNATVPYASDSARWQQTISIQPGDSLLIKGTINYFYKKEDAYLSDEQAFRFMLRAAATQAVGPTTPESAVAHRSLLWIFLTAFAGGLLALLTPCVYSMIPVTVSFFTKRSKTKAEGIRNALYYAASIVIIFTVLGFFITVIFGPAALNNLATNWIANLVFFAMFLAFGISFLGAFDIALPSSWSTKADSKASTGSFFGIFFMALTLAVVSFSCTGPIIGNLLVLAAKGSYWGPLTGMAGFSLALALPFALFAFFPSKLNVLGKAGGWLNAVKVTLGFLELALALKFLSNADLSKGWRLLDREIFLAAWIVIFFLLGSYLLGKLKFHHDDELSRNDFGLPYLGVPRLFFGMAALIFAVYMIPGLWGAPLKGISAFLPPMGTQDFTSPATSFASSNASGIGLREEAPHPIKYYEQMKIYEPEVVTKYGMVTYFDYNEALAVARKVKKPLMLDFTGINCVNCRKMEGQVWSDPQVMKRLKENFVIASLYVDVHNVDLPESEQYRSKALDKQIENLGDKNTDMQVTTFNANTQPYYFFLDGNEKRLAPEGYGYDRSTQKFIQLLDTVKEEYRKRAK